jgi:hypothetical protein
MAEERVILNGVDATTGKYATPALEVKDVAALAQGLPIDPEHLEDVKARAESAEPCFGIEFGRDPERLEEAGWGVVFAAGADPAIREALAPLLERRKAEAGDLYREFTADRAIRPGESARAFLVRHGAAPGPATPTNVPYYLLLVGEPERIPFRVQFDLGVNYAVGRVAFETTAEYAAWARAVVDAETGATAPKKRRAFFFATRHDDDGATQLSARSLGAELPARLKAASPAGWEIVPAVPAQAQPDALRDLLAGQDAPAVLFTATHGMVFPLGDARQAADQGALLGQAWPGPVNGVGAIPPDWYFAADDVPKAAKLGGMIAFHFACYGAGTPELDDFAHRQGKRKPIAPRAFVAALPRALLARGALAAVGHVERAWSWSFQWPGTGEQLVCFEGALKALMAGRRLGTSMEYFAMKYTDLLAALNGELEDVKFGKTPNELALANLWTASNDARNYIIVGDPAVRVA